MGEDVELCLEIQVDPASKKILSNPEKCRSALLDVTVVKPKELEAFGTQRTNTLKASDVRKLITSMEKQRRQKQKVLDKLKYDDTIIKVRKHDDFEDFYRSPKQQYSRPKDRISSLSPVDDLERKDFIGITESVEPLFCEIRRSLKNVETRITNMQDINLMISQTTVGASASEEFVVPKRRKRHSHYTSVNHLKNPLVYRSETLPRDLRSVLVCKNKNKYLEQGDKIEGKCLCENCGIVGLLLECQKQPLLSELSESPCPSDYSRHNDMLHKKKKTRFNMSRNVDYTRDNDLNNVAYINQLTRRVKQLEQRLAQQEERVVPKDYFRKIMSKILSTWSGTLSKSKSDVSVPRSEKQPQKNKKLDEKLTETLKLLDKALHRRSTEALNCFRADLNYKSAKEPTKGVTRHERTTRSVKNDKSTITDDDIYDNRNVWRWGGEILKPGIDLKNRIVTLLNDILSKFPLTENISTHTSVKENVAGSSKRDDDYSSETIKRFMKHMNAKVIHSPIDTKAKYTHEGHASVYDGKKEKDSYSGYQKPVKEDYRKVHEDKAKIYAHHQHEEKTKTYRMNYQEKKQGKNIDVSYVNPKLNNWRKDSPNDCKTASKPVDQKPKEDGKQEFLKIVSKAKQYQKDVLWRNIWNQAKANGQSKEDKITIKIPVSKKDNKGNELFETDLTIGEVEAILKGFSWP